MSLTRLEKIESNKKFIKLARQLDKDLQMSPYKEEIKVFVNRRKYGATAVVGGNIIIRYKNYQKYLDGELKIPILENFKEKLMKIRPDPSNYSGGKDGLTIICLYSNPA